jgi:hypothetical protein
MYDQHKDQIGSAAGFAGKDEFTLGTPYSILAVNA